MKQFFVQRGRQRVAAFQKRTARQDFLQGSPPQAAAKATTDAPPRLGVVICQHPDQPGAAESNSEWLKSLGCTIHATSGMKHGEMYSRSALIEGTTQMFERVQQGFHSGELCGAGRLVMLPTTRIWTISALCPAGDDAELGTSMLLRAVNLNICYENRFEARGAHTGIPLLHQYLLVQTPAGMTIAQLDAVSDVFEASFGGVCEVTPGVSLATLPPR